MRRPILCAVALTAASLTAPAHAITAGQTDTFSSGVQGWTAGGGPFGSTPPVPPAVVATGGPAGAGDAFLQITSGGGDGPGSRLVAMNVFGQWSGNYTAAGVTAISMDLKNLGQTDLTVRLYFEDPIPNPPANEAVSDGFLLRAGADWTHAVFAVTPAALTVLQGSAGAVLGNTTVLRIFSNTAADFPPEQLAGVLGVDNIHAIPEPATALTLLAGLALLAGVRQRRRR